MVSESKRREVLQLLREYRAWHSPFGGAMPLDETGLKDANYGPAGYVESGQEYRENKRLLAESYEALEHAITLLKADGQEGFICWMMLLGPYLGDPGDPSIVTEWRKGGHHRRVEWHDLAIEKLAGYLRSTDLFVAWPKRMSSREEKAVERMNDEFYSLYQRLREEGYANRKAIQQAATMCGYSEPRGYEIVRIREGEAS